MFVVADGRGLDSVVMQQLLRMASVFAGDQPGLLQDAKRPQGDVFEIADRRGDQIKSRRKLPFLRHIGECSIEKVNESPILIVFGGLPGVGKTVIAKELARQIGAVYLRADSIEQALRDSGTMADPVNDAGYRAAYAVAGENLCLGLDVIADCVNPLHITREAWREVARQSGVGIFEVEVTCSDQGAHKLRVERRSSDIPGLKLPTWQEVVGRNYEPWDREHAVVDSAQSTIDEMVGNIRRLLKLRQLAGKAR